MLQTLTWPSCVVVLTFPQRYVIIFMTMNLYQLVKNPTRIKGNISDLIIVKSEEFVSNLSIPPPIHYLFA